MSNEAALLKELVILVDDEDNSIGSASKLAAHTWDPKNQTSPLHRAFSVFIFDANGQLVLQQRSKEKLTFAGLWTNSVCSHPLASIPDESCSDKKLGVKNAAIRRIQYELGVPNNFFSVNDFRIVGRIHYKSQSFPSSHQGKDGQDQIKGILLAEHEIDYILFVQAHKDIPFHLNDDEEITPWYGLIARSLLGNFWDELLDPTKKSAFWDQEIEDGYQLPPIKKMNGSE
ncbi:MAG: putative isopentenyl-diphosphate Delta-isomerase 1 [Streblomastix strix]|uniref:isopentenyl-diphosphate Delta-isomerase n=2 Tax=Streblomastix strix TaxID=222440 RepID=A0A5J4UP30_9EUKA|nr:MAG: putative isopentenyl-diphosphate Delta-isomerase 1 [Streblomastix strix]